MIRILKIIGIVALILALVFVGLILIGTFGYKLNPVQRQISNQTNQWHKLVELNHRKLEGVDIQTAHNWLSSKGFKKVENAERVRVKNPAGAPNWKRTYEPINADATFIRNSGNIACNLRFVVVLDDNGELIEKARGMVYETGCL